MTIPTEHPGHIDEGAFPKVYKPREILGMIVVVGCFCDDELAKAVTMIQDMELPELSLTPAVVCDVCDKFFGVFTNNDIILLVDRQEPRTLAWQDLSLMQIC